MRTRRSAAHAFTLVEVLVATAVLAMAVAGLAQVIVSGQMLTREALHHARASELAEALLEEILALPYADPQGRGGLGPEAGETTRAGFDNTDDFDGFNESTGNVSDAAGQLYPEAYAGFSRRVTMVYESFAVAGFSGPTPGLTVTVTVRDSAGHHWSITRFIAEPTS